MYSCTELEATAREFIFQNFLLVSHTEEFFELSEDQLIGLLQSDKLHVTNENQVRRCVWSQLSSESGLFSLAGKLDCLVPSLLFWKGSQNEC